MSTVINDSKAQIVLIDDDIELSNNLIKRLKREESCFNFQHFPTEKEALEYIASSTPEVAVVDLNLVPGAGPESGLSLIRKIFNFDSSIRILALTGHSADDMGLAALRAGAASFLQKPSELPHLLSLIRDGVAYSRLKRENVELIASSKRSKNYLGLSSKNKKMLSVIQQLEYAASNSIPLLLLGETGTGKGVVSRAIHAASARKRGHFIRLQPQYGSPELVASELFGHSKGAFTGAQSNRAGLLQQAHRGTLFLDEVDLLPVETQVALLEALQEGVFRPLGSSQDFRTDIRLLSASNKPQDELIGESALRQDFYHRIAHCVITLPPLRERKEDIADLANLFVASVVQKEELGLDGLTQDALTYLEQQPWPGNIRQLQACVEAAAYKAAYLNQPLIELSVLTSEQTKPTSSLSPGSFRQKVREYEYSLVKQALEQSDNNQTQAAQLLELDRSSFRRILKRK